MGDQFVGKLGFKLGIKPVIDPLCFDHHVRIGLTGPQGKCIYMTYNFRNGHREHNAHPVGMGHIARDHASQIHRLIHPSHIAAEIRRIDAT